MERQINQIALSVSNLAESIAWYGALGLEVSGGQAMKSRSEYLAMWRVPEREGRMEWLVGRNPMTQLELFHFTKPSPRPLSPTRTARDEGYGSISIFVVAFEQQLNRLKSSGTPFEITGAPGSRSLWVKDPDRIPVELMERDVRIRARPSGWGDARGDQSSLPNRLRPSADGGILDLRPRLFSRLSGPLRIQSSTLMVV